MIVLFGIRSVEMAGPAGFEPTTSGCLHWSSEGLRGVFVHSLRPIQLGYGPT
jgi:hypothetical protein